MNFLVFTDKDGYKVVLNLANVITFNISKQNDELTTVINTTNSDIPYYVKGDITKDLAGVVRQAGGTYTVIR